jgi:hypothetical protein
MPKASTDDLRRMRETLSEAGVDLDDKTTRKISDQLSKKGLESARPKLVCEPDVYCIIVNAPDEI